MLRSLSVISLLLAPAFALFNPNPNVQSGQTCSGFYYEGINTFYVDCFDQIGNLVAQDENFYEFTLDKICNQTVFSDISSQVTGWRVPSDVTNSTQLNCCDYFQRTVGYVFTECDNGINALIIPSKVSGNDSATYQNMTTEFMPLNWNWNELKDLLDQNCGAIGGSGSGQGQQLDLMALAANWQQLPLNWSEWNTLAQQNQDVNSFDKATLKQWILIYGNVSETFANFQPGAGNDTGVVNNTITQTSNDSSGVANVSATNITEDVEGAAQNVSQDTEAVASNVSSAVSNATSNTTQLQQIPSIGQSNFNFWLPNYDDAAMTVDQVRQDLTTRGIYNNFVNFFNFAFGPEGFVSQNRTNLLPDQIAQLNQTQQNATQGVNQVGVIPSGMESIVAWISENVDREVQMRCTACQFNQTQPPQNQTPPADNATLQNQTSNVTGGENATDVNQTIIVPPVQNETQGAGNVTDQAAQNVTQAVNETIGNVTEGVANATSAAAGNTTQAAADAASNATAAVANATEGG